MFVLLRVEGNNVLIKGDVMRKSVLIFSHLFLLLFLAPSLSFAQIKSKGLVMRLLHSAKVDAVKAATLRRRARRAEQKMTKALWKKQLSTVRVYRLDAMALRTKARLLDQKAQQKYARVKELLLKIWAPNWGKEGKK